MFVDEGLFCDGLFDSDYRDGFFDSDFYKSGGSSSGFMIFSDDGSDGLTIEFNLNLVF